MPPADAPASLPPGEALGRVVRLEETCARYGAERVRHYAARYSVGDELAYGLLRDVYERGGFGWPDFHRALDEGVREDDPESLRALFADAERIPDWVDFAQLRRGAVAYWRPGAIVALALTSDIGRGFKNYGGMKPTIFTGRLIDEAKVGRRMVETLRYIATVTAPGAMERSGDGFKYTLRLRMLHASVRWGCSRAPAWDWDDWGLPVSSADNLGAPLEFSVGLIDMLEQAGIVWDEREREDIVALWRYIAFVLGTPEDLLMTSVADARERLEIMDALNHPPDDTNRLMLHSLVDYAAREGIGYDPFPAVVSRWLEPARRKALIYGFMYAWAGEQTAREMAIPRTRWRHVLPAVRPALRARDACTRRSPARDAAACARMLANFSVVTDMAPGESPLADPDEVAADIGSRRGALARLFS